MGLLRARRGYLRGVEERHHLLAGGGVHRGDLLLDGFDFCLPLELSNLFEDVGAVGFDPGRDGGVVIPGGVCAEFVVEEAFAVRGDFVGGEVGVGGGELAPDLVLREPAHEAVEKVGAALLPLDRLAHDALGHHAPGAVMEVGELVRDLHVERRERLLALGNLGGVLLRIDVELLELFVEAVHRHLLLRRPILHLADTRWLEDAPTRLGVAIHLHRLRVDGGVDDDPCAAAQLAGFRDVDEYGLLEVAERVDNHGAKLENLARHVARPAAEPSPVGEDDGWQPFAVEVPERLRRLVRAVGEPHLASLREHRLVALGVGGVGRDALLHRARLHRDGAHRDAAEPGAAHHHRLAPLRERLGEGAAVEEAGDPLAVRARRALEHVPRVVRGARRLELHVAIDAVRALEHRWRAPARLGHVAQPFQDGVHAVLVVLDLQVRHAVRHHHLRPAELVLRVVHLAPQQLVQRLVASENHRPLLHLDVALAEAAQVSADADAAPADVREREGFVVCPRRLARNHARTAEVLDADAVHRADDVLELVAFLAIHHHLVCVDGSVGKALVVVGREVEVLEAGARVARVVPRNFDQRFERLDEADPRARVRGDVHARDAELARVLRRRQEKVILLDAERAAHERAVVGDDHYLAALHVLRGFHRAVPRHHADGVGARHQRRVPDERAILEHELLGGEEVAWHAELRRGSHRVEVCAPRGDERLLHEAEEVVAVGGADAAGRGALLAERAGHRVRVDEAAIRVAVRAHEAEGGGGARHGVEELAVRVGLEPLTGHGGGHDAERGHGARAVVAP
mmetsp:Transcript_4858/g.16793  ORF Transcript_4858/g.16793 Transcript_4858/m.16793 type:complete len:800 (+) Transcript_4858:112-2511(+)